MVWTRNQTLISPWAETQSAISIIIKQCFCGIWNKRTPLGDEAADGLLNTAQKTQPFHCRGTNGPLCKLHPNEGDDVTLLVLLLASIQQKPKELKRHSLSSSALFASAFLRASGILWCRPGIHTAFPVTLRKYVLMALRQMSLLYIITHRFDTINASNPQFFFQINKQWVPKSPGPSLSVKWPPR